MVNVGRHTKLNQIRRPDFRCLIAEVHDRRGWLHELRHVFRLYRQLIAADILILGRQYLGVVSNVLAVPALILGSTIYRTVSSYMSEEPTLFTGDKFHSLLWRSKYL